MTNNPSHKSKVVSLNLETQQDPYNANGQIPEVPKVPLLFLDVNLSRGVAARLTVYQGDDPE
jgi:hypothetical protein